MRACVRVCVRACRVSICSFDISSLKISCMDSSSVENSRHIFYYELSPIVKLWPFEKNRDEILYVPYLENIRAGNLKLDQLIGGDE